MLVAYYSAQGHTRAVAEAIADRLDADLFEVTPVEPYADEDLDWTDESSRMGGEPGFVAQKSIRFGLRRPKGARHASRRLQYCDSRAVDGSSIRIRC